MKEGPDIALLGALIGDPARANMLTALMSGMAHTATELAGEAGVTLQTASSHLAKLENAGLLVRRKQGRHRYFALADDEISSLLEAMMGFAAKQGHLRARVGPRDPALRRARVCYNHLAGEFGVQLFDSMVSRCFLDRQDNEVVLTDPGRDFVEGLGIDLADLGKKRRPMCKSCLDWSARRTHLAGSLGVALLDKFYALRWAKRLDNSRTVAFTRRGEQAFQAQFPMEISRG